uniref:NADH dehydrogenase subunit 5 n=1 Tax=Chilabothrus argentum TaxID=1808966 RepID=UPI002008EC90|nr:NADH dehydrogenase subunit 5 [Chilabothrus argentum]UPH83835.1 NADH dehydrogenase subunit 5 [Chilabothrus argentum]
MDTITPTLILTTLIILTLSILMMMFKQNLNLHSMKNNLMITFIISLIPLNLMLNNENETIMSSSPIINLSTMNINTSFILDYPSLTFIPIAMFVTWSIVEFSMWYMSTDPHLNKFIKHLFTFLIAMLIIITANNMFQLFVGWEGVGIMSFLLIGWWYSRSDANTAALQAIIYNRIGDIGLIMTTAWMMNSASMNIQEVFTQHEMINMIPLIGLIAAAMGKSAQFGLHPWLPMAMEGPTPVSALLHSSTMVVAGVFLLIRLHPIMQNNKTIMTTCLIIGALTTMFAAASAITQHDIKKIIALSTTSQLGLMMTMVGLNQPMLAFLHMSTHSFFKALLFLCSGSLIHNLKNEQDIRKMGGLNKTMPMTTSTITVASFTLMGMPFLSGFYSKDTIIETIINSYTNSWALTMTLIATMLSAMYSMRIIYFTLIGFPRTKQKTHQEAKPSTKPILRLTIGSILIGTMTKLSTLQTTTIITMPKMIKLSALTITLLGLIMSMDLLSMTTHQPPQKPKTMSLFFNQLAFFNTIHRMIPMKTLKLSQQVSTELIDQWTLENYGPKGLTKMTIPLIHTTTQQKNLIKNYLTLFTLTIMITLIMTNI